MRVRHGFVSNSSSSSFILYGVSIERTDENDEALDKIGENDGKLGIDITNDDGVVYIGKQLMYGVEAESVTELDIPDELFCTKLLEILTDNGIEAKREDIKLYAGNVSC